MSDNNITDTKPVTTAGTAVPDANANVSAAKAGAASDSGKSSADSKTEDQHPQHPQHQQQFQGNYGSNYYQGQGSYPNNFQYGQNVNPNYNGSANFHKGQYNNSNKHHSGNRQNFNNNGNNAKFNHNSNNQNNPNAQTHSHRKLFSNTKMNHPHSNQQHQQQQQQYMGYGYGAAVPQAYQYGYMPQYYVPMPYMPPGSQSYVSPTSSASSGSTPQYVHAQTRTPPVPKVKLTTKDGKPVDLEEKKKKTASSTPVASPFIKHASPAAVPATNNNTEKLESSTPGATSTEAVPPVSTDSPVPAAASTSTSTSAPAPALSAAEEFKRKIREKAAAAAAAKEKEKKVAEGGQEKETPKEEPKTEQIEAASKEETSPDVKGNIAELGSEEKATDSAVVKGSENIETSDDSPVATSVADEGKTHSSLESTEPVEVTKKDQDAEINAEVPVEKKEEQQPESKESESAETNAVQETKDDAGAEQAVANTTTPASDEDIQDASAETETSETTEQELNITQFMKKIAEVPALTNILDVTYPENINGVDSSKQIPSKKYRYDPQFLIQFRDVVQYPIDGDFKTRYGYLELGQQQALRRSGSTRDSSSRNLGQGGRQPSGMGRFGGPHDKRGSLGNASAYDSRQNSRTGSKRRGASTRDKSTRKPLQSKRGRNNESREPTEEELAREAPKPAEDVKPLEKSANRWVPKSRAKKTEVRYAEDGSVILEKEDVERKIKSLLNKLTLEMFNEITDEMLDITKQSKWETDAGTIKQTISLTFQKACDEPYWSEMYAKWCAKMTTNILPEITDESSTLKDGTHPSGGALARRVLLTTCQVEYEKGWSDKLPTNPDGSPLEPEMMSDEYYAMAAAKRRGLGLVKFIGHLYNLNMLNDQVIYVCLKDQCSNVTDPSEDSLENLAQLIKTVGPKLDANDRTKTMLKIVFDNITTILSNVKLSSRIKFMLMDLQDLRKARWQSGKQEAQPTTIEAIHRDAEIKKLKEEREKSRRPQNAGRGGGSLHYGSSNIGGGGSSRSNSGFGSNSASNSNFFRKSPSVGRSDSNVSRSASERGSSSVNTPSNLGGSDLQRDSSRRSENQQVNRFAALGGDDEDVDDEGNADVEEVQEGRTIETAGEN